MSKMMSSSSSLLLKAYNIKELGLKMGNFYFFRLINLCLEISSKICIHGDRALNMIREGDF